MIDPVALQVLTGAMHAVCEEMGAVLIRSAHSANIKERRDASTAMFAPDGEMVMQAEHIPVHLGSMPAAVAAVLGEQHAPGHSWILNDPYAGGTHLPDITVITPVFAGGELIAFVANRAHHADVGGPTPGSMPADSSTLADEGVVISPRVLDEAAIAELSAMMRQPDQRRGDLRAQLAANRAGVRRLQELHDRVGAATLRTAFAEVLDYAERRTRACLAALPDGTRTAHDVLEPRHGQLRIALEATVRGDSLRLDFSGTSAQHDGNLNCPLAVTRSACYFAIRVLTDPEIPPSAGAYRPIEVHAPEGCLLNARSPAAVVGGNVETSSRIADVVMSAFGRALGQGTMNNLTLGSEEVVYYETIGGGQGACPDADGPSGVHVAMSNTLNTPVEALELEFPLRVTEYSLRRGSGGEGRFRGGDGVIRELEALESLRYSLMTERRRHRPLGAAGGRPGAAGANLLDGEPLPPKATGELQPGQRLRIETPGGGGHGRPTTDSDWRNDWIVSERVAFLGLGIMGSRMAANLARAGFVLTVWNRTPEKAERFCADHEAELATTPAEAAAAAEVVFTMVVDGAQVEQVLLGSGGVADGAGPGVLCVDCSTIGPTATRAIGATLHERGLRLLDAPVTGSAPRAEDGTLTIMAGGEESDFQRARPALEAIGKLIVHAGPLGNGQMVKVINNAVAATNAAVVGQAMLVAARADVDLDALTTVMGAGSGGSTMLDLKAGAMRAHDYSTLFKLAHMLKDVRLCLDEGEAAGAPFEFAAMTREILNAAMGRGLGEADFAALIEVLEGTAGIKLH